MEQVDEASGNAMAEVTTAVVEAILEPLRPAMVAMRAKVEVGFPSGVLHVLFTIDIVLFLLHSPKHPWGPVFTAMGPTRPQEQFWYTRALHERVH